jgi:hypothetical protein
MLDKFLQTNDVKTEFFMTMDSDCFPISYKWLNGLIDMMNSGVMLTGIMHPWAPPPSDLDHKRIDWRVRSQQCWETTHVACQMLRYKDLQALGVSYAGGDDTGLLIPMEVKKRGGIINGYRVTRCPKPKDGSDPEFNRYVSLVFGDRIYHHGGFTRIATMGDKPILQDAYGWVLPEILAHHGASFLLSDEFSYEFKFDREELVAKEKMDLVFGSKTMGIKE